MVLEGKILFSVCFFPLQDQDEAMIAAVYKLIWDNESCYLNT